MKIKIKGKRQAKTIYDVIIYPNKIVFITTMGEYIDYDDDIEGVFI